MTQGVRGDAFGQPGGAAQALEAKPESAHAERGSEVVQEQLRGRRGRGAGATGADVEERRTAVFEVGGDGAPRGATQEPDALFPALAQDSQLALPEIQRPDGGRGELADPEPGGVCGLDQGPVTKRQGGVAFAGRLTLEVLVDDREHPLHLVEL